MKIKDILYSTKPEILGNIDLELDTNISTDTRTIKIGDLYLPLKGENFNGENFIEQAFSEGAVAAFCSDKFDTNSIKSNKKALLKVEDTLTAYLQLANYRRITNDPIVVAVTGSSGKTTTKELIASVLSVKHKTFKTPLNHNNEIGLCQTIFEAPDDTEVLVLEMGMRGLGEIELLSRYAQPDISVICNVGTAHIGRLGSKENIAKAKCEIVNGMQISKRSDISALIAHDNELIKNTVKFSGDKIFYAISDVTILEKSTNYSKFVYRGNVYELNVGGDYNIENALAAINVGEKVGLSTIQIQNGLKKYKPIEKRWEKVRVNNFEIVNDSYNANPESMKAFIDTVLDLYKDYVLILGDMGELGTDEVLYHKNLGKYINEHRNLNSNAVVISIGNLSENITGSITQCKTHHFSTIDDAVFFIKENIKTYTTLFLKASRSMKFEKIIEKLASSNK